MSKDITLYSPAEASRLLAAMKMYASYYDADATPEERTEFHLLLGRCEVAVAELERQEHAGSLPESDNSRRDLCDYFAAFALTGMIARTGADWAVDALRQAASDSYQFADAMMAEREKRNA